MRLNALRGKQHTSSQMKDWHLLEKPSGASLQSKSFSALPFNAPEKPSASVRNISEYENSHGGTSTCQADLTLDYETMSWFFSCIKDLRE